MNLSLVLPTRNRSRALGLSLLHLSRVDFPFDDFEVLVVDDGSDDDTSSVLQQFRQILPLRPLHQSQGGTSRARNRAIEAAQGRFVLFVDDDVLVPSDFLRRHLHLLLTHPGHLIRGPVVNVSQPLSPPLPPLPWPWRHHSQNYLCTSNASLERYLLLRAGLFDPEFPRWEDAELGVRLKRLGVRRIFDARTYVYHWKPPLAWPQRLQVAALDGQAAARLYRRYPSWPMWLRTGLHGLNRSKNRWLSRLPLPASWQQWLELERVYLEAGGKELRS